MAGFAGILRLDGAPLGPTVDSVLEAMGSAIAHRGLGERRVWRSGPLAMVLPPGADFGFDGRAAPEGLVRRYAAGGAAFLDELEGPFALALWDQTRSRLLLARDRVGLRPLFHCQVAGQLLFGSELKALLAHPDCPRELDWLAALAHEAMPRRTHPRTSFFPGLEPLRPGALLEADARAGTVETRRWYQLPFPREEALAGDGRDDAEIILGYRAALERAVDGALGDEAGQTGILLSGGIDSVSIASLAARRARIPTFTVLGQSTFGNGDAALAHRAAAALGLPEHQVLFRVEEPISPDEWRRLLWLSETPACAFQNYYKFHLYRAARERVPELRRMLNGEGSDELSGADFRNHGVEDDQGGFDDYLADLGHKQREEWHTLESVAVESWMGRTVFRRELLERSSGRPVPPLWQRRIEYCLDGLEDEVLWRDDRLGAGCGLAADAPFMDHRLLEYVMHVPARAHPRLFWKKRMLREAMAGVVPEALRDAPKIPFFGGVDSRFTARLLYDALMAEDAALVREGLGDGRSHPVLANGLLDDLLDDLRRDPQRGAVQVLLTLTNLGLLERMAREAAVRPGPALGIPALTTLSEWDEPAIAARLAPPRPPIDPSLPLAFAPNVYLVRPDNTKGGDDQSFLVVDDQVRFVLDGEETLSWRQVLRRVDGQRPLATILDELGLELAAIRKHLEEAIDFEVVSFSR